MRRYSSSLLVQESGFHQLVAEFNKGQGIPRASLAQEVAVAVADAMTAFSQVFGEFLVDLFLKAPLSGRLLRPRNAVVCTMLCGTLFY